MAGDVSYSSLDEELFDGAGVTKGALVEYLEGIADRLLPGLAGRALSVIRARPGQPPFMQKNLPKHAPAWIERAPIWAEASQRMVDYPVCGDLRTLQWFANQRAVEYHPSLARLADPKHGHELVLDIDPPEGSDFGVAVAAARLVRSALRDVGLDGAVKTSGAKGLHVVVPIEPTIHHDAAAATRAIAERAAALDPEIATTAYIKADRGGRVFVDSTRSGWATVVAAYSPRARPGVPVSFPLGWDELDGVAPGDVTVLNALDRLGDRDPWADALPGPVPIPTVLLEEGHEIPIPRVAAMHEGRRRRRAAAKDAADGG